MSEQDKPLTPRQREIMDRIDQGWSAPEIADDLNISRNAVYDQTNRMKRHGYLSKDWTFTGVPPRASRPDHEQLRKLVPSLNNGSAAAAELLVLEVERTRDELKAIARRLDYIVPS